MRVCILMAAYNGAAYIGEQIRSVLSQTYADFELHISDDGSTDETVSIIKEFMKADPRIKLLEAHRSTGDAKNNFFYLLEHVQGDVFLFCDQDDVWTENHCEALIWYRKNSVCSAPKEEALFLRHFTISRTKKRNVFVMFLPLFVFERCFLQKGRENLARMKIYKT